MYSILEKLNLLKIGEFEFADTLSGGRASETLVYKNQNEEFILKLLIAPRNEFELARFKQEAEALRKIDESLRILRVNVSVPQLIIPLTQHEELPVYYFLMEKVEGLRLDAIFDKKPLPWVWDDALKMLFRISSALKYIELRFIHRDLHPLNIIVQDKFQYSSYDGMYSDSGIKILDFGCTKDSFNYHFGYWNDDAFRVPGAISSWSPELLMNPNEVDHKHDSWALGVLFYRFLTGKYPYPADCIGDIIEYNKNLEKTFKEIDKIDCPLAVKLLVRKCLELDKNDRFSVTQIVDVCNDVLHSDLLTISKERTHTYFSNGASLYRCDHCFSEDISGLQNRCLKCGQFLDQDNMTTMLKYK